MGPFMEGVRRDGAVIVSDGWDNIKDQPLLNILVVTHQGVKFLRAVDMSKQDKTGANIARILGEAVEEVGAKNVVAVITDGAANCKLAGKILMER